MEIDEGVMDGLLDTCDLRAALIVDGVALMFMRSFNKNTNSRNFLAMKHE